MRSCSRSLAGVCATVRAGLAGEDVEDGEAVSNRPILPQAESVKATHSKTGAAKRRRPVILPRSPARSVTSAHMPVLTLKRFNSRRALQSAPLGAPRFVAHGAPRQSRGPESVDFRGT